MSKPVTTKLKEAISAAEEVLNELKDNTNSKAKRRYKKINKVLEQGYKVLNSDNYSQKEVDKRTDDIWIALKDEDSALLFWFFIFGVLFTGALVFTAYETYSFIQNNWDNYPGINRPDMPDDNISHLVTVNYKETSIVNLTDLMTVSDSVGLKNPPQEFQISNDSSQVNNLDYLVNYSVNIIELNSDNKKILDKKYIKYQVSYTDEKGNNVVKPVGTFADLEKNPDGSYLLVKETQEKDGKTDFKVIIWLSSEAENDQQGSSYTFMFNINASVAKV